MKQNTYQRISFVFACLLTATSADASSGGGKPPVAAADTPSAPRQHQHTHRAPSPSAGIPRSHRHHHDAPATSTSTLGVMTSPATGTAGRPPSRSHRHLPQHVSSPPKTTESISADSSTASISPIPSPRPTEVTIPEDASIVGGRTRNLSELVSEIRRTSRASTPTRTTHDGERRTPHKGQDNGFRPRHSILHDNFEQWATTGPNDKTAAYHAGLQGHRHQYPHHSSVLVLDAQKGPLPEEQHAAALYHLGAALHTARMRQFQLTPGDFPAIEHLVHLASGLQPVITGTDAQTDTNKALEQISAHNTFCGGLVAACQAIQQKVRQAHH